MTTSDFANNKTQFALVVVLVVVFVLVGVWRFAPGLRKKAPTVAAPTTVPGGTAALPSHGATISRQPAAVTPPVVNNVPTVVPGEVVLPQVVYSGHSPFGGSETTLTPGASGGASGPLPPVTGGDIYAVQKALEKASKSGDGSVPSVGPVNPVASSAKPSGRLELVGIMQDESGVRSALLRKSEDTEVVTAGEDAFGYHVTEVTANRVTLISAKGKGKPVVLKMEANG